ncbi:MAG TPA: enoyl-CoA hydratase-related protein [Polyangiaceae bacterium]|jgi:enoyl-CoA hydratase/carnithine racemase|nr:enoyl-CoA hydratase-related protein [Polyangiaceae bacterium]
MTSDLLLEERDGAVLILRLNRPQTKNALSRELTNALGAALAAGAKDVTVRAIVLTGSGGSFCSGVDLKEAAQDIATGSELAQRIENFHAIVREIVDAPQPVIAAVDGPAVGFGADLCLACDLRLLSERAYLQEKFVAIGLMPDGGGTFFLPRLLGLGKALEVLLLGEALSASAALALGLASKVVPSEELEPSVLELARRLAAGPPLALSAIKHATRRALSGDLPSALAAEKRGQLRLLASADVREGVAAFLEKRAPSFRGQ